MIHNPSYALFLLPYIAFLLLMIHDLVTAVFFLFTGVPLFLGLAFLLLALITKDFSNAFLIFILTWFAITIYGLISIFLIYICNLFWSLCVFYTFGRGSLRERCRCLVSTPHGRRINENHIKIRPKDSKLIIYLNYGIITLHSQSYHANSTYPVTIAGGLTIFCFCRGVPKNLRFYSERHSFTKIKTTCPKTKFLILYKSQDSVDRKIQPLTLKAYCLLALYQYKLENLLNSKHSSIPSWFHKFSLPIHRGHVNLVGCNDDSRWVSWRCEEHKHCFTYHNERTWITD
jgi:hypothetical protein